MLEIIADKELSIKEKLVAVLEKDQKLEQVNPLQYVSWLQQIYRSSDKNTVLAKRLKVFLDEHMRKDLTSYGFQEGVGNVVYDK